MVWHHRVSQLEICIATYLIIRSVLFACSARVRTDSEDQPTDSDENIMEINAYFVDDRFG